MKQTWQVCLHQTNFKSLILPLVVGNEQKYSFTSCRYVQLQADHISWVARFQGKVQGVGSKLDSPVVQTSSSVGRRRSSWCKTNNRSLTCLHIPDARLCQPTSRRTTDFRGWINKSFKTALLTGFQSSKFVLEVSKLNLICGRISNPNFLQYKFVARVLQNIVSVLRSFRGDVVTLVNKRCVVAGFAISAEKNKCLNFN